MRTKTQSTTCELNSNCFVQIPLSLYIALGKKEITQLDVNVYAMLLNFLGQNDYVWPSQPTIGEYVGRDGETVGESYKRLEEKGFIERVGFDKLGSIQLRPLHRVVKGKVEILKRSKIMHEPEKPKSAPAEPPKLSQGAINKPEERNSKPEEPTINQPATEFKAISFDTILDGTYRKKPDSAIREEEDPDDVPF